MLEDIRLNEFPHSSGVYWIIWNGSVIYIGSSKDLYERMRSHKWHIRQGFSNGYKKGFYLFLQNNPFTVEFELTENYREKEQDLIEYYEPIFNKNVVFTTLSKKEYIKQYRKSHKDEIKQQHKQWCNSHKGEIKQYNNQYHRQKCFYNGEILTLMALAMRFQRQGIPHPTIEAKKYVIEK